MMNRELWQRLSVMWSIRLKIPTQMAGHGITCQVQLPRQGTFVLSLFSFCQMDSKLATRTEILADNSMSVVFERNRLKDMGYVYTLELFYSSHR